MKHERSQSANGHPSLSDVQNEAENEALELLRLRAGYRTLRTRRVKIGEGYCQPDGVNSAGSRIVEVYAHVGPLKGAQSKKVAQDILKLAAIRRQPGYETASCEIFFVDRDAMKSVRGWMKEAAREFGVNLRLLKDFSPELRERLVNAQERQSTGTRKND